MSALRVAPRDAAWFAYPGTAYVFHAVREGGHLSCCGIPITPDQTVPYEDIRVSARCRRPGCRAAFSAATTSRAEGVKP